MGIFSSFFGFPSSDAQRQPEQQPRQEARQEEVRQDKALSRPSGKPELPPLSKNMVINVFLKDGTPLLSGKILEFVNGRMSLERVPGQLSFSTCDTGTEVYLRGLTSSGAPFELKGVVCESSRIICRLQDLDIVTHEELRSNFRLPLRTTVNLYYEDDRRLQSAEQCQLVNISVGGACFESEYIHGEGEILRLKVKIEDYAPMIFLGEVIRVEEPKPGLFRYGFLFAQLDDKEAESLMRMLFNIQVGTKNWNQNPHAGTWE